MRKNYKKASLFIKPAEPPAGLFDRIILAIKREQELQHTRRLLFVFTALLLLSLVSTPFSWSILTKQAESSGIVYFLSAAVSDFGSFLANWKDFILSIFESLPVLGVISFTLNISLVIFTLRLFLRKRQFLLKYFFYSFN